MQRLAHHGQVCATFYKLEECLRPIGTFRPGLVPIIPLGKHEEGCKFYPPRRRGRDQQQRKRAKREGDMGAGGEEPEGIGALEDDLVDGGDGINREAGVVVEAALDEDREEEAELGLMVDGLAEELELAMEPPEDAPNEPAVREGEQGAAASEPAAPEAPPPPPVPEAHEEDRQRGAGEAMVVFPFGKISYYESKKVFEATCRNPAHGKCVLTRTCNARGVVAETGAPRGGRPVGFLAAWLLKSGRAGSKAEHWSPPFLKSSLAERQTARDSVERKDNGPAMLLKERPTADGEPSEPPTLDGLA